MPRPAPMLRAVVCSLVACVGACTGYHRSLGDNDLTPAPRPTENSTNQTVAPAETTPVESAGTQSPIFPAIRVDTHRNLVEFDAVVSPLIFEPYEGRTFYLEQFVCKRGTKDHESLVVTDAVPSQIHAALLLIGLVPGEPVSWTYPDGNPLTHPPKGPALAVEFVLQDSETVIKPRDWTNMKDGSRRFPGGDWLFAGSLVAGTPDAPFYEADAAGTIVGLASFGTEVIAWGAPISHEEAEGQLEWVADLEAIPPAGTPLVVRVRPALTD